MLDYARYCEVFVGIVGFFGSFNTSIHSRVSWTRIQRELFLECLHNNFSFLVSLIQGSSGTWVDWMLGSYLEVSCLNLYTEFISGLSEFIKCSHLSWWCVLSINLIDDILMLRRSFVAGCRRCCLSLWRRFCYKIASEISRGNFRSVERFLIIVELLLIADWIL